MMTTGKNMEACQSFGHYLHVILHKFISLLVLKGILNRLSQYLLKPNGVKKHFKWIMSHMTLYMPNVSDNICV